jgi:integrase
MTTPTDDAGADSGIGTGGKRVRGGSRRGHREGTIYQRADGRWEARMSLGDGAARRKSFMGKTRAEVARKLAMAQRDRDEGVFADARRQTLRAYLLDWLETIRPTVEETTWQVYEYVIRGSVIPAVGRVELGKLTAAQVQLVYADRLSLGASASTVRLLHAVMRRALGDAERMGLVPRNVTKLVRVPKVVHREMRVLSEPDVIRVLDTARQSGDRLEALWVLAFATGMRKGELCALCWRHVELAGASSGAVLVQRNLKLVYRVVDGERRKVPVIGDVKRPSSRRRIALDGSLVAVLREHRRRQLEERMRAGAAWTDKDLVFCSEVGTELYPDHVRWHFQRLLQRAGVPRIRFHDTRHTAATLLLMHNVPVKVVSEMLGHSAISMTLDLYGHVTPDMQAHAAAVMGSLLGRSV